MIINSQKGFFNKDSTDALKGISIIMIVLAHICQYEESLKDLLIGGKITYSILLSWGAIGVSLFFLLSGYGCYLSIINKDKLGQWTVKHIIKILCHFIVIFAFVVGIYKILFDFEMNFNEIIIDFITLRFPGATVWYLKVQILFYLILFIAAVISKKHLCILVITLSLLYAIIGNYVIGLPDFWWKTCLCFSAGCLMARYKDNIQKYLDSNIAKLTAIITGCCLYYAVLKDEKYIFFLQLMGYVVIAISILIIWNWLIKSNFILQKISNYSLDLYLVHIGVVLIIVLICHYISECLEKKIIFFCMWH